MAYIGNPIYQSAFVTDTFSGNGFQTAFTLSRNVATVNDILVVVNNVDQQPSNYTVSGNTLTFSPPPSAGTNNIYVRYLSTNLIAIVPQQGTVSPASLSTPNALYWDTSGNVGVGTTNPAPYGKFVVAGSTTNLPDTSSVVGVGRYSSGYGGAAISTNGGATFLACQVEGVDQFRATSTGLFQFNSGYGSVATAYGCRAWVNFNGTGTIAIRASGNVSSITDNGVGVYTVNFTTAMPDANYVGQLAVQNRSTSQNTLTQFAGIAAGSAPIANYENNALTDIANMYVAIFR
jgi:hypothetical protein